MLSSADYIKYINILREELIPALGCTEPIAIAYTAAKARDVLGVFPDKIIVATTGNIIKNVKGVVVPNTGGMRGIKASAIIGAVAGDASKKLEVLTDVKESDICKTRELMETDFCSLERLKSAASLHICIKAIHGEEYTVIDLMHSHTNIVKIEKNGKTLYKAPVIRCRENNSFTDYHLLSVAGIYDFANTVIIEDVAAVIDRQIEYNLRIAENGLEHEYGANVGATLLRVFGAEDKINLAKAYAAAGSDARMSGCILPVIINSGSGNQGMAASLPVIIFARHLKSAQEDLYRALVLSNLIAIYQKTKIGRLSAYCGAVSAACGSGAGISYLYGGDLELICKTITNTLANISGMVCDGAKPSCAAKIASAVDAAILGHYLAVNDKTFKPGEGLVKEDIEKTILSIGLLASKGMRATDNEILRLMIENDN